jgi:hypothetical protein
MEEEGENLEWRGRRRVRVLDAIVVVVVVVVGLKSEWCFWRQGYSATFF